MTLTFSIEPDSGCACIAGQRLHPFQPKAEIEGLISHLVERSRDHGNGYEWLYLRNLSFGGVPATVSLCFHDARLEEMSWGVTLPDAADEGWPTRKTIDAEVAFVRTTLAAEMGLRPDWKSPVRFDWGEIWNTYDARADCASHGLRYRAG